MKDLGWLHHFLGVKVIIRINSVDQSGLVSHLTYRKDLQKFDICNSLSQLVSLCILMLSLLLVITQKQIK